MLDGASGNFGAGQENAITAQDVERDQAPKDLRGLAVKGGSYRLLDVGRALGACDASDESAKLVDIGPVDV